MPDLDMRRMQEEAARRAREMQSRARQGRPRPQGSQAQPGQPNQSSQPNQTNQPAQPTQAPPPAPPPAPEKAAAPQAQMPPMPEAALTVPTQEPPPGLLEELFKDKERTVLLALLILLGNEGGNHELMFALLFLLM